MKVLIGVDGSEGSCDALRQAASLLSHERDQIALYYTPPEIQFHEPPPDEPSMTARVKQALADGVFAQAREHLPEPFRATLHNILGTQSPRRGVMIAADEWRADLIVLGARGAGPIRKMTLGTVATSVSHAATVPVLVTRPRPADATSGPWRVLLATDGSEASRQAGDALRHCTWPTCTEGFVMTVVEAMLPGEVPDWLAKLARDADSDAMAQTWTREHEIEKDHKRQELAAYRASLPTAFQGHPPIVAEGHAAEQILKTVDEHRINLIVVGAQGKSAWQRFMLGSTSETLLAEAPCSVLVVRQHRRA
jgi:nucleotide-binding universal stress UspA family protein